jgi:hypothetical protein
MMNKDTSDSAITTLTQLVENTCFCKLRETCSDKNSSECMRHRNIYAEFMQQKREERTRKT